jgi:hypothetical protein
LFLYGPTGREAAEAAGLSRPNTHLCGLIKSAELVRRLRAEVDVLFVPMSFAESDRPNMEAGFPSKLTEYTATGLPLLILGPAYCSAVRWARENDGVAEVVDVNDARLVRHALDRLRNPLRRSELAANALAAGQRFFSHRAAQAQFHSGLSSVSTLSCRS